MECPECGGKTNTVDTHMRSKGIVRRRRCCLKCRHKFSTLEYYEGQLKSNNNFDRRIRDLVCVANKLTTLAKELKGAKNA